MNQSNLSAEELAADEHFIRWVKSSDEKIDAYWEDWILRNPEKQELLQEAQELVLLLQLAETAPSEAQVERMRQNVTQRITRLKQAGQSQPITLAPSRPLWFTSWQRMAAAVVGILLVSTLAWMGVKQFNTVRYRTGFGETKSVTLPDGSTIELNANSSLSYNRQWNEDEPREVWLAGEGFFNVTHKANHQPFLVHTDEVDVKVLGTTFNVWQREDHAKVVLVTGKIELSIPQQVPLLMKPGELVEITETTAQIVPQTVNTGNYTAWKEHQLIFDHATLEEVARVIENQYGMKVQFKDPSLREQKLTLKLPSDDLEVLLESIQRLFNLKITQTENQVILEKNDVP